MRCENFDSKRNWSWLGFCLAKLGGLVFCALLAKLVNICSCGFWAFLVGNFQKCIENDMSKVWLQKELILVGFGLAKLGGMGFCALLAKLVKKWSHGFWAILVGNCHKCIQNEVWKDWLQKAWIWLGFGWAMLGGLAFCALVDKLVNKWSHGF